MNPSAYAGHRKIVHVGIDTFDPGGNTRQTTKPLSQTAHRAGLLSLLCEYTDLVEFTAADAVCLDITYNTFDIPFGARVAKMIKGDIKRQLGLGISVGLGPTKLLAKLAMASARPDGLTVVLPEQLEEFLVDKPIDLLPGVGEITRQHLAAMGIECIGQLARLPQDELVYRFGQRGNQLWLLSQGRDDDPVAPAERPSQISEQIAFDAPVYGRKEMRDALRELATALSGRLQRRALRGRLVIIEVHYPDFSTTTRTLRLPDFTDRAQALFESASELLAHTEAHPTGVRQLGIGLGGFAGEAVEQLDLFA